MSRMSLDELRQLDPTNAAVLASDRDFEKWVEGAAEKELQKACESYLRHRGYWPRQPDYIAAGPPPSGWYLHLVKAKRNPLVLDLLIIHERTTMSLEVELKTATGPLRKHQRELVAQDARRPVVRTMPTFIVALDAWEAQLSRQQPPADMAGMPVPTKMGTTEDTEHMEDGGPDCG